MLLLAFHSFARRRIGLSKRTFYLATGADCSFFEKKDGWHYEVQKYPYGATEEYNEHGPFSSEERAKRHLDDNYANPGSYSIHPLKKEAK